LRILGRDKLEAFKRKYPASRKPLSRWEVVVESAEWASIVELKTNFPGADYVDGVTVFNIGGNKYRLITILGYLTSIVQVEAVLTHEQYDRGGWKK
jgi:mRNA interferase HigB